MWDINLYQTESHSAVTYLWYCAQINRVFNVSLWQCVLICLCFESKFSLASLRLYVYHSESRCEEKRHFVATMLHRPCCKGFGTEDLIAPKSILLAAFLSEEQKVH